MTTAIDTSLSDFTKISELTTLVLQTDRSHPITDGVTAVHGYLQLATLHPAQSKYREELRRSIIRLAGRLARSGRPMLAMRVCAAAHGL